jgi:hypothetical protein
MNSNENLIPPAVVDLGERILDKNIPEHIRENYLQRMERVIAYGQSIVYQHMNRKKK